ncbi:glycosyl transferase group 1 [[Clostridium] sordellii]|uniref:glycosyltransferase n=1 Tax=Paraclostridium sordellii TaxID=1505 RepID=UPI0005E5A497|nr:glycosyltransferase [Paeniclostridium sordellii]CEN21861.1 glycosyl transferase group 1 [[Clostridium] sordellii] [Paeniclostridium sordellii]CEP88068.1 glycosyl transferase group 1 [[Clostridium] sordellii] [Paeniclostridium sordellii]
MKVLVVADSHIFKSLDGTYWCKTIYGYEFWKRYLMVFEEVRIVSRVGIMKEEDKKKFLRVDGPGIEIYEIPFFRGAKEYINNYFNIKKEGRKCIEGCDCAIFRLPSVIGDLMYKFYKKTKKPYCIEIVADPEMAYADNYIAKKIYTNNLKKCSQLANGVAYVTKSWLQSKYPSYSRINGNNKNYFESYYSTIDLEKNYFGTPKNYNSNNKLNIVHTANNINNHMKGHDTVIKVLKNLVDKGINANVVFIGDGDKKLEFKKLAQNLGVEERIEFTGFLSSKDEIRNILLNSDLFLFPSKAEGLPRAIIEAMAVGLPCISTPVNGIPELLDSKYLFEPDDIDGFTNKIIDLLDNTSTMEYMSKENILKVQEYEKSKLDIRRNEFYKKLRDLVE